MTEEELMFHMSYSTFSVDVEEYSSDRNRAT